MIKLIKKEKKQGGKMNKYEIDKTLSKINDQGVTLYRVRKISNDPNSKGEIGGWVETENNLSQQGKCWIYDEVEVSGEAKIKEDACIFQNVKIRDKVEVKGKAVIKGDVEIYENASISGNVFILGIGNTKIHGHANISGDTCIWGNSIEIYGSAVIEGGYLSDNVKIYDHAKIKHFASLSGDVEAFGNCTIKHFAILRGKVKVCAWACIKGDAILEGDMTISQQMQVSYPMNKNNSLIDIIAGSLGLYPDNNGNYIMYKRVIKKGDYYCSYYNRKFKYRIGKIARVKKIDLSCAACTTGIHLSTPYCSPPESRNDWVLIQCLVNINDIVTCQDGAIRCKKCLVLREVEECTMHKRF